MSTGKTLSRQALSRHPHLPAVIGTQHAAHPSTMHAGEPRSDVTAKTPQVDQTHSTEAVPDGTAKLIGLIEHARPGPSGCLPSGSGDDSSDGFERESGGRRMVGHGDLKLLTLALIEQAPRHGYELIRLIGEMFRGQYAPSPGAIYPALSLLETFGRIELRQRDGGRKLYAITPAGRAFLDENRATIEMVAMRTSQSAREAAKRALPRLVRDAMNSLKHALLMRASGWTAAEARRVAAILTRAAREIAGGSRE